MSTPSLAVLPIRRLALADLPACADLSADRGWPREEHKWRLLLTAGTGYGIDDPHGGLAASCVLTAYGPPGQGRDSVHQGDGSGPGLDGSGPGLTTIGMMLVAERHARQGVGRRLLRHVIDSAHITPLTLYATASGRPLYEQLGFKATGQSETVQGHFTPPVPGNGPAPGTDRRADLAPAMTVRPAVAADLPYVLRLDRNVFGADRTGMITRLPAFADRFHVAEVSGRITGYAAAWPTMTTQVIGPLIARDAQTAQALVTSLAAGTDRPLRTDVNVRHHALLSWLKDRGLVVTELNTVMVHGTATLPGDPARNFAPLTVAAG